MIKIIRGKITDCGIGISVPEGDQTLIDLEDPEFIRIGKVIEVRRQLEDIIELLSEQRIYQVKEIIAAKCNKETVDIINSKFDEIQKSNDKQFKANLFMQIIQIAPIVINAVNQVLQNIK